MAGPTFEAFDDHQRRAIQLLDGLIGELAEGMSRQDVVSVAEGRAKDLGFDGWFHAPAVSFGSRRLLSRSPRLSRGDLVSIDVAPGSGKAFGDIGASLVFGEEPTELVVKARGVCQATCGYASERSIGHVGLPPEGLVSSRYPRSAWFGTLLHRHQVRMLNPRRMRGFFALRVPITDATGAVAWFEEMVYVDDNERRLVGRDSVEEIGHFPSLARG